MSDDFDFDFGFSAVSSEDLKKDVSDEVNEKVQKLRGMVMVLLKNLLLNPDKDIIHWPNREKQINEFIKKIDELVDG